ncbi:MAG: cell wall-binding repeat-containing protein [Thermoleophilaceae bacterium]|nr:cell wall-binding repeat-containing protein [Thermoleophilaceae bacterium]
MSPFRRHNRRLLPASLLALTVALTLSGCTLGDQGLQQTNLDSTTSVEDFSRGSGSPALTTRNTIRIPGADPAANAAAAAITVYPSSSSFTRPTAVSVVEENDWREAIAMSVLSAPPLSAPLLLSGSDSMPDVTKSAMAALSPSGVVIPGQTLRPKAFTAGTLELPDRTPRVNLVDDTYENLSLAVDRLWIRLTGGKPSKQVIVTTADPNLKRYALPAGPLAANTGSPVFFVNKDTVPLATLRAIQDHKKPSIYVVGPEFAISDQLLTVLRKYGTVRRIAGPNPTQNAVEVATFSDPATEWGWGITDPGHGFVITNSHNEMNVAAATTLSAGAAYGPLLLNSNAKVVDRELRNYLLDEQSAYIDNPANAVYNRAWLLGDEAQLSPGIQATFDKLLAVTKLEPDGATGATGDGATAPTP